MDETRAILLNEIRYAERLCQRTARLYRHLQAAGTFGAVLGGSAVMAALSSHAPTWLSAAGLVVASIFGAALIAMRPADKAAANEADQRRYARLRSEAGEMDTEALRRALNKARESDAAEVETLRLVAYNDVMLETGNAQHVAQLSWRQKALAVLA